MENCTGETAPDISVVIPIFNEEGNLEPLLRELAQVVDQLPFTYEVICVDDRSTDNSLAVLTNLQKRYPVLRIVCHTVNCGQSAAEATGFAQVRGRIVITMDADLQNDPADIPAMLEALGDDIAGVCGVRRKRADPWLKRKSSRIANRFRNFITGDRITDAGCTLRVLRRNALRELPVFNGMHRFLPTLLRLQGFRVVEIPVNHRPRTSGNSKYGIGDRLWRGLVDCLAMCWFQSRCVRADRCSGEIRRP